MLVINRKSQEKVRIGHNIFVQVDEARGNHLRMAFRPRSNDSTDGELRREPADLDRLEVVGPPRENRPS